MSQKNGILAGVWLERERFLNVQNKFRFMTIPRSGITYYTADSTNFKTFNFTYIIEIISVKIKKC